jgi:hypothetical protein
MIHHLLTYLFPLMYLFRKRVTFRREDTNEDFVKHLHQIQAFFDLQPRIIYYPYCGDDISVNFAFPKSMVYLVDDQKESIQKIKDL